jgi:holo-[acyl-carrier protein] synthase
VTPIEVVRSAWNASVAPVTSPTATVGAGIDLVEMTAFARHHAAGGQEFLDVGWTRAEQRDAQGSLERLAARWAAKEAVMKALRCGLGVLDPLDVEILTEPDGAPRVVLHQSARAAATALGVGRWHVSLCHEDGWAAAIAIAERLPSMTDPTQPLEGNQGA